MATSAALSRLSTFRISSKSISSLPKLFKSSSQSQSSATISRVSRPTRLPVELSCCSLTMMPLHSAIASARLCSDLSKDSQSWCLIPQDEDDASTALRILVDEILSSIVEKGFIHLKTSDSETSIEAHS